MFYIDIFLMLSTFALIFAIEILGRLQLLSYTSKIYYVLARKLNWKKLKLASKYPKAIKQLQNELSCINSKEEFSKWAKLNRRLEKLRKEHTEAKKKLTIEAVKFQIAFCVTVYVVLYGSLIIWALLYRSSPTFRLPPGFVGPLEKILSMPGSPLGSVSVLVWLFVCKRTCSWVFQLKRDQSSSGLSGLFGNGGIDLSAIFQATSTVLPPETLSI